MNVAGTEIPDATINAAEAWVRAQASFSRVDLVTELVRLGVPLPAAIRATDRLLQRMCRAGEVSFHGDCWHRRGAEKAA